MSNKFCLINKFEMFLQLKKKLILIYLAGKGKEKVQSHPPSFQFEKLISIAIFCKFDN